MHYEASKRKSRAPRTEHDYPQDLLQLIGWTICFVVFHPPDTNVPLAGRTWRATGRTVHGRRIGFVTPTIALIHLQ